MTMAISAPEQATAAPVPTAPARAARRPAGSVRRTAARIGFAVAVIGCWELAVRTGLLPATSIPTATDTAAALGKMLATSGFWTALGRTAVGWSVGLLICCVVAIPAGLLIGMSPFLVRSTRLPVDFLRTIPAVALIPVLLLVLGPSMQMKLVLVVFGSIWPLLTSTIDGVRHVDPVAADTVRSFRLSRFDRISRLVLPSALPFIVTGVRICAVLALMLTTAAEYLGSAPGVGKAMGTAQQAGAVAVLFAWLVVVGLLGVAVNSVFLVLERRLLPWAPANRNRATR